MTYTPSKSIMLKLWRVLGGFALGRWLVAKVVCFKAPYFGTIKPRFTIVKPGCVELGFKKRRAVHNHINTVHAIAMCNAAELAAGICCDISLSAHMRWIPIAMQVQYLKKAKTDLRAVCKVEDYSWDTEQDVIMPVSIYDTHGDEVFQARITMKLSPRVKAN